MQEHSISFFTQEKECSAPGLKDCIGLSFAPALEYAEACRYGAPLGTAWVRSTFGLERQPQHSRGSHPEGHQTPQSYGNSNIGLPRHWQWPEHRVFFTPPVPDKPGGAGDSSKLQRSHSASPGATQACLPGFKMPSIPQTFKMPSMPHMSSCTRHHELQLSDRHPPQKNPAEKRSSNHPFHQWHVSERRARTVLSVSQPGSTYARQSHTGYFHKPQARS